MASKAKQAKSAKKSPKAKKKPAKKSPAKKPVKKAAKARPQRASSLPRERAKRQSPSRKLLSAIDAMQDAAPGFLVQIKEPPPNVARTPWMIVVRFSSPGGTSYNDVFQVLNDWQGSREIERGVGAQRLSRIQIHYIADRGRHGEYTIAEIGPWELAISRAVERVGIRDDRDESLMERYGEDSSRQSEIDAIVVWFSSANASEVY